MAEKRYFWIKLRDNFFSRREIKKLRKIAGGDTYTIIYLKLQLLSLRNGGKLYYEGVEDTFYEEMALELDEDPENVKFTIIFLQQYGLIEEVKESEYLFPTVKENTGSETAGAERTRRHREKKKMLQSNGNVTECNEVKQLGDVEKTRDKQDIEQELEQELEQDIRQEIQQQIINIVKCEAKEAKTIINTVIKYHKNKDVVAVVLDKLNIISKGNFNNRIGALVSAIKEDWTRSSSNNTKTSGFCNFEGRDYQNGYGGLTYEDLEEQLVYGVNEEE